jgi:CDP-diacylglycerol pyrophosphatase
VLLPPAYLIANLIVGLALTSVAGADAGRDQLRVIVQQQCLPHWTQTHDPSPCVSVRTLDDGSRPQGFAVLLDRKGGAHFLLIPTRTITGIESPEVRGARALNFFAAAWEARYVLVGAVGHTVPRSAIGMAVNQYRARSQDQLHIPDAARAMDEYTVLVAGMQFEQGPGFAVLAGREVPGAELLLDANCTLAR